MSIRRLLTNGSARPQRSKTGAMTRSRPSDATTTSNPNCWHSDTKSKSGIDIELGDQAVQVPIGRPHQIDLARKALTRADTTRDPFLFDNAPLRKRKSFKNEIRRILTNDGSVKVYDDQRAHNRPFARP